MKIGLVLALLLIAGVAVYFRSRHGGADASAKVEADEHALDSSWNYQIGLPVIRGDHDHRLRFSINRKIASRLGTLAWVASYSASGHTARFTIEIDPSDRSQNQGIVLHFGKGRIISAADSDSKSLLPALAVALDGHVPQDIQRQSEFPFDYVHFGDNMSEIDGGGFQFNPAGGWTAMKLFLNGTSPEDSATVYFSFNPGTGEAQLSNSNSDYGDDVIRLLAPVL